MLHSKAQMASGKTCSVYPPLWVLNKQISKNDMESKGHSALGTMFPAQARDAVQQHRTVECAWGDKDRWIPGAYWPPILTQQGSWSGRPCLRKPGGQLLGHDNRSGPHGTCTHRFICTHVCTHRCKDRQVIPGDLQRGHWLTKVKKTNKQKPLHLWNT